MGGGGGSQLTCAYSSNDTGIFFNGRVRRRYYVNIKALDVLYKSIRYLIFINSIFVSPFRKWVEPVRA
jgi:hypothetical protein